MIEKILKEFRPYLFYSTYRNINPFEIYYEDIPNERTIILAPHYYWYDFLVIDKIMKKHKKKLPYVIAKYDLTNLVSVIGGIRVPRKEDLFKLPKEERKNLICCFKTNLKYKLASLLEHDNLLIFPEGTRSEKPLPIRLGVLKLLEEEIKSGVYSLYFVGFDKELSSYEAFYLENNDLNLIKKRLEHLIEKFKFY
jgi:hypothetical protein